MGLIDSASSGDRVEALRDLRDELASSIVNAESARDVAALSRQFTDVLAQIDALSPMVKVGDPVDEITARRAARGAISPTAPARASKRGKA